MHLVLFLFVIVACSADLNVTVDQKGGYQLSLDDTVWLRSARTALYADDKWYSSEDNSLPLINITASQGTDPRLGDWKETQLNYELVRSDKRTAVVGRIRQWSAISAVTFDLESGEQELTSSTALDMNHVHTVFPSFHIEKIDDDDQRGFFTYEGEMAGDDDKHAGRWDSSAKVVNSGVIAGPVVLFDFTRRGEGDVLILSPFTRFMATSLSQTGSTLEYGVMGSMSSVPANYNHSLIIFYSPKGINEAMRTWGQTMRKAYNRTTEHRQNDLTINYLGYYTDNGGYYYYNTEKGINYEQTIIDIRYKVPLPMHYIQLDSWWYFKGIGGGVTQYTAMPDVFPDGLAALHRKIENIPLAAHNRYWAFDTVYKQNYSFALDEAGGKALPIDNDTFWFDLFTQTHEWGLIVRLTISHR